MVTWLSVLYCCLHGMGVGGRRRGRIPSATQHHHPQFSKTNGHLITWVKWEGAACPLGVSRQSPGSSNFHPVPPHHMDDPMGGSGSVFGECGADWRILLGLQLLAARVGPSLEGRKHPNASRPPLFISFLNPCGKYPPVDVLVDDKACHMAELSTMLRTHAPHL